MLVVKDISRLARNTVDLLQSVRQLKAWGIEVVFLTANMTSMGDSEFVLTVFGALAQEESRNTSKRVKFSKRINGEKGRVPNLVYGYDKTPGDYFHLAVNEKEAAVVRRMYRWYAEEGWGGGRIADQLNQQGLRTKRGCAWSQAAVCRILTNLIYTGQITNGREEIADFLTGQRVRRAASQWQVTERPELRIVSDDLFRRVGELMQSRREAFRLDRKRRSGKYLFSTLIVCKSCGWSFRRVSRTYRNTYTRWVCSRHNGRGADSCPNSAAVDEGELADRLNAYFLALLMEDPGQVERVLRERLLAACKAEEGQDGRREELRERLAKLTARRQKLLDLYTGDLITRQELDRQLSAGKAELLQLEEALHQLELRNTGAGEMERVVRETMAHLADFVSVEKLNNLQLKRLVAKIEVDGDGTVHVYLLFAARRTKETPPVYRRGRGCR